MFEAPLSELGKMRGSSGANGTPVIRGSLFCIVLVFLSSCGDNGVVKPINEQPGQASAVSFDLYWPGQAPWQKRCFKDGEAGTTQYVMNQARRYRGVWSPGYEVSSFVESSTPTDTRSVWLDVDEVKGLPKPDPRNEASYELVFIGREPICDSSSAGGFGHMNASDRLIVVDRVFSVKQVAPR